MKKPTFQAYLEIPRFARNDNCSNVIPSEARNLQWRRTRLALVGLFVLSGAACGSPNDTNAWQRVVCTGEAAAAAGEWVAVRMHAPLVAAQPAAERVGVVPLPESVGRGRSDFMNPPQVLTPPARRIALPTTGDAADSKDRPGGRGWLADGVFARQAADELAAQGREMELLRRRQMWRIRQERSMENRMEAPFSIRLGEGEGTEEQEEPFSFGRKRPEPETTIPGRPEPVRERRIR